MKTISKVVNTREYAAFGYILCAVMLILAMIQAGGGHYAHASFDAVLSFMVMYSADDVSKRIKEKKSK